MDVSELRLNLIDKIMHMKADALKSIETVINDAEADWWDLISKEEQVEINEGLSEIEKGETVPHSEVMKIFDKWK